MPSYYRNRSASPETVQVDTMTPPKTVGFPAGASPVTSVSRPLTNPEQWTLYNFEAHARTCTSCLDPYHVHRRGGQLCAEGHVLAQEVACIVYSQNRGHDVYDATLRQSDYTVRVELPHDYIEVRSLLKAMERSLRHRRQKPIVSLDQTYPVMRRDSRHTRRTSTLGAPTSSDSQSVTTATSSPKSSSSSLSRSSRQTSPSSKRERRRSQIVDWPEESESRAPPSSWRESTAPSRSASVSASSSSRTSTQVRPLTPENRMLTRPKLVRSSPSQASSSCVSDTSASTSPSRTKAARAATLAFLEAESAPAPTPFPERFLRRDGAADTPATNLVVPVTGTTSQRRTRRASLYDGALFTTEVREPRHRRWSAVNA